MFKSLKSLKKVSIIIVLFLIVGIIWGVFSKSLPLILFSVCILGYGVYLLTRYLKDYLEK